jgi:hypothetical protein
MPFHRYSPAIALTLAASCFALLGCGAHEQEYSDVEVVTQTPTQQARQWLQGVAQTGQLDSGVETIKDTIGQMREAGVDGATVDALLKDAEQLAALTAPQQIRTKAQQLLSKLPPDAPATPAE